MKTGLLVVQKIKKYSLQFIELFGEEKFIKVFLLAGFTAIVYSFAFFIASRAVDIPYLDQWSLADIITDKTHYNFWQLFFYQHNEHRIGVGLLIIKFLASFSNWSQLLEIKFISFLLIASAGLLTYAKYLASQKLEWLDIFIPFLVLNIFQVENLIWGFQISFILPFFFLSLWLVAMLKIKSTDWRYSILTIIAFLSSYSSFHGLFLPLITIGLALFDYFKNQKERRVIMFAGLANILIIVSYFIGYVQDFQTKLSADALPILKYFSTTLSGGFFYLRNDFVNYILLFVLLVFLVLAIYRIFKPGLNKNCLVGLVLIIFGVLFILTLALGRSSFGLTQGLSYRYITFSMLLPLGLFFVFADFKKGWMFKMVLFAFMVGSFLMFSVWPIKWANDQKVNGQRALGCYTNIKQEDVGQCYKIAPLFPEEKFLDSKVVEVLRWKKINGFKNS
ncbi:MAG: hypothetical protein WC640_01575 [Candidatus Paceibacterota bacterium]|jgi:hypothetical protein